MSVALLQSTSEVQDKYHRVPLAWHLPKLSEENDLCAREILGEEYLYFFAVRNGTLHERKHAIQKIIGNNMGLVDTFFHYMRKIGWLKAIMNDDSITRDDVLQELLLGLHRAVVRYDIGRGKAFSTYAMYWIRQAATRLFSAQGPVLVSHSMRTLISNERKFIRLFVRDHKRMPTDKEICDGLNVSQKTLRTMFIAKQILSKTVHIDEPHYDEDGAETNLHDFVSPSAQCPETVMSAFSARMRGAHHDEGDVTIDLGDYKLSSIQALMNAARISARDQNVISHLYGLQEKRTLSIKEAARVFGVSHQRIYDIQKNALHRMRQFLTFRKSSLMFI